MISHLDSASYIALAARQKAGARSTSNYIIDLVFTLGPSILFARYRLCCGDDRTPKKTFFIKSGCFPLSPLVTTTISNAVRICCLTVKPRSPRRHRSVRGKSLLFRPPTIRGMRGGFRRGIKAIFIHGFRRLLTLMLSPLFACDPAIAL